MVEIIYFSVILSISFIVAGLQFRPKPLNLESSSCWKYKCGFGLTKNVCIYPVSSNQTYLLSECSQSSSTPFCNSNSLASNVTCSSSLANTIEDFTSYPGEPCIDDDSCVNGSCINSLCFGGVLLSYCSDYTDCNPGLRCSNNLCTTLLNVGQFCTNDYDCVLSAGCNNGICTKYLSLPVGSTVSDCNGGDNTSLFCSGFSCIYNYWNQTGICINPFVSSFVNDSCSSYKNCVGTSINNGTNGVYTKTTSCDCGMNSFGTKYCSPQDGNITAVNFRYYWKLFMDSGLLNKCNTARRFEQACFDLSSSTRHYLRFMQAYYDYFYYAETRGIDACTTQIFYPSYFDSSQIIVSALVFLIFN